MSRKRLDVVRPTFYLSGEGATRTLLDSDNGSRCLFDRAAGIVYTLPTPTTGMVFDFDVLTTVTSNSHKIITSAATIYLIGTVLMIDTDSSNTVSAHIGNGSSHIAILMNGTTTGGLLGSWLRFTALSTTRWLVEGVVQHTSNVATPFSAS